MFEKLFITASTFMPENILRSFEKLMVQGGFTVSPREYAGYSLLLSLFASILVFQVANSFVSLIYGFALSLFTFVLLMGLFYLIILMAADGRARKVEEVLPDALQMMSANIRAGMTMENAIWMAAKPEFGPLEEEIRIVSGKAFGGKPVEEALGEMSKRVRSGRLGRAVRLLTEGMQLGGELAPLLDEVARDLKVSQLLAREIASATTMYMIFIIFTACIASPIMFAASVYYASASYSIAQQRNANSISPGEVPAGSSGGFSSFISAGQAPAEQITPDEISVFAVASISLTTFFGALLVAQIRYGKVTRGITYIPMFMIPALLIFYITNAILRTAFGFLF